LLKALIVVSGGTTRSIVYWTSKPLDDAPTTAGYAGDATANNVTASKVRICFPLERRMQRSGAGV
jgi:hypothetical protein